MDEWIDELIKPEKHQRSIEAGRYPWWKSTGRYHQEKLDRRFNSTRSQQIDL